MFPNPPYKFINEVQKLCFDFVWDRKRDKTKRSVVIHNTSNRGINIPDIKTYIRVLILTWLMKFYQNRSNWRNILWATCPEIDSIKIYGPNMLTTRNVNSFGMWKTICPFPDVVFQPLLLSALSCSPFHCALQNGLPDLMNGKHVHTTAVCVSLRWSGDLHVVQLPAGSWRTSSLVSRSSYVSCCRTSFPWLVFFFGALLRESMIHKHTGSASVVSWNWEKYSCLFQTGSNLVNVAVVCAILESISGLEPSSVITELRYLGLWLSQASEVHNFVLNSHVTGSKRSYHFAWKRWHFERVEKMLGKDIEWTNIFAGIEKIEILN